MDGDKVQDLVYDWLVKFYPKGPGWQDPDFDCYNGVPIEIKMISAFDAIEYNIGNGGWAQFLWNCFACWRQLIAIGEEGYRLINAPEQATALRELRSLCERNERDCEALIQKAVEEDDFAYFGEFTSRGYNINEQPWQRFFFSGSGIYEKRLAWLADNEGRIRKAVGALNA